MAQDHQGFNNDGNWPRWLLHVDSLTSYAWRPGNRYGESSNPPFNAITYTWGRFQTDSTEVKPFPLEGITWKAHLPRIQQTHFSTTDMAHIIRTAACPFDGYDKVDFLWIDIACIDQSPKSEAKAKEIGRQAKIFKKAKDVFVWLTSHNTQSIKSWAYDMDRWNSLVFKKGFEDGKVVDLSEWIKAMNNLLTNFTRDQWFKSLWTLQEAFLRPDAMFVYRDGLSHEIIELSRDGGGNIVLLQLKTWIQDWISLRKLLWRLQQDGHIEATTLLQAIDDIGFIDAIRDQWLTFQVDDDEYPQGSIGNPFNLLVASNHRNPWRQEDRVYGIMQVFDLKLGESAPEATRYDYSLEELIDQLGTELLKKYPISSQLVVHQDCPENKAWRIGWKISLPEEAHRFWRHFAHGGKVFNDAEINTRFSDAILSGCFAGRMTTLKCWQNMMVEKALSLTIDKRWQANESHYLGDTGSRLLRLQSIFPKLGVCLLGRTQPLPPLEGKPRDLNHCSWGIGLLINPTETAMINQRIGTLIWSLEWTSESLGFAHGIGDHWHQVTDYLFG